MDNSNIIERVCKLMAMADDASSPNEAAIAARRARILMDKHQIAYDDLESANQDFAEAVVGGHRKFVAKWEQGLAINIAQLNDCQVRFSATKQFKFEGLANDVEVCKYMHHYLSRAAKRQCSEYLKGLGYTRYNARLGTTWKAAFASILYKKMQEQITERQKMVLSSGKELIVVKMALVVEHFGAAKYSTAKATYHNDAEASAARDAGRDAGRKTSIHTGVGTDGNGTRTALN